jgi:long-subunit fatty acid transport protein
MKTDLTSLTKYERPLYFGLIAGIEKFGTEMMAFSSQTANEGQYMRYGRNPLFLNMGGAMQVIPGIDVGASARITLHSEASLIAQADLAGNTEYEKMDVSAQPSIRPIVGASFDFGTLFCQQDCMFSGIEAALVYRAFSNTATTVTANTVIPGTIPDPGLTLAITTLDSWQPDVLAVGLQYKRDDWRVALTLERQNWSDLGREFRGDTIKDQAAMSFSDITIPRLGAEMRFNEIFFLTAGVALEKSPLKGRDSLNVNYFDNDKVVVGLGLGLELANPPVLAFPVRLDLGYQYQQLKAREFDLTAANAPSNPYETVEAEGDIHILSGSITLKF